MKLLTAFMLSAGIMTPAFVSAAGAPAAPAAVKSARLAAPVKVTTVEGITEYRLGNGMRVLLFPDNSKPTLTTNIVYMVGSRHENYGETGMAHLLEHLLFKPTANFGIKKGTKTPVEVLNSTGAEFNGTTWYDRTNYYSTFPANEENLATMLALEADRMVNAPIDQNDLWNPKTQKGEMTVVRNEFEMGESDPIGVTTERLQAVAFDWHNYGKSTIGARSDIEQVNIPRLRAFYKNYYQPDNAVLMVAGRFDEAKVLKQINDKFGRIPKPARVIQPTYTAEPTQDGERSVTVRRNGGTQFVGAGYHQVERLAIEDDKEYTFGAGYKFGIVEVKGNYMVADRAGANNKFEQANIGAAMAVGAAGKVFVNVQRNEQASAKGNLIALAYSHSLSKRTNVYATVASMRNNSAGVFGINASGVNVTPPATAPGADPTALALGIRHAF